MENHIFEKDIPVFYVRASSFPEGIEAAHEQLRQLLPSLHTRQFFGLSRPEHGVITYKAAVEELFKGEGKTLGCDSMILKKGTYTSLLIKNYRQKVELISEAFRVLLADPRIEREGGYCVEQYTGENDVYCMVKLKDNV